MRRFCLVVLALAALPPQSTAQPERYDAGRRLIAFEQAWDRQPDAEARKRAIPLMKSALTNFFANKYSEASRYLDAARNALVSSEPPNENVMWAQSLSIRPDQRLVEPTESTVKLGVRQLYNLDAALPGRLKLSIKLAGDDHMPPLLADEPKDLPTDLAVALRGLPEGDHRLDVAVAVGDQLLTKIGLQLSVVRNRDQRLAALKSAVDQLPAHDQTTEQRTLKARVEMLSRLTSRAGLETDFPAYRLFLEAEELAALPAGHEYFDATRPGQFWFNLATEKGEVPLRMMVPTQAKKGEPLPLVIAMHGAGGTENMFFDAYGHGEVVRQCEQRGWLLVAPRANFIGSAPIAAMVDELAKRYPVDPRRIFLVGHSMGAGQAVALAQQMPDRWAGVAALGGAGRVSKPDAFRQVPLFIGCGTEDFALNGSRAMAKMLQSAGLTNFVCKEYRDIEHIIIVQVALPDVFKWYDQLPLR